MMEQKAVGGPGRNMEFEGQHCGEDVFDRVNRIALVAERNALRSFAQGVMRAWPHGDVDGGDLQELAHANGLLVAQTRTAPCREEGCACAEQCASDEFDAGVTCYRQTALLLGSDCTEPDRGACPRLCIEFCNRRESGS